MKEENKINVELIELSEEDKLQCELLISAIKILFIGVETEKTMGVLAALLCGVSHSFANYDKQVFLKYMECQWHFLIDNENPKYK